MASEVELWKPAPAAIIPAKARTLQQIADCARLLNERDRGQIVRAAKRGDYEMASSFLWQKSMHALKRQLGTLGIEFLGELLDRPDFDENTRVTEAITDHDALKLAEELGMFGQTDALRLRQGLELVTHFGGMSDHEDADVDVQEGMNINEFTNLLRVSVQAVLGHERLSGAVRFSQFRHDLESRVMKGDDEDVELLKTSAYFLRRTTLRILVALAKTATGAASENGLANFVLLVPILWPDLQNSERLFVGRAYAEVHSAGQRAATSAIGQALMQVRGFDFVPEDLRSRTFLGAARAVKDAHFGMNNFFNEPAPMATLAGMGTSIPAHALGECVSATLCVRLGNPYGVSWAAVAPAKQVLAGLSKDRWRTYLDDYLSSDDAILSKLSEGGRISKTWAETFIENELESVPATKRDVRELLKFTARGNSAAAETQARQMYNKMRNR
jgi:hypothetical protein